MEALTVAMVTALTIYDMCKVVDKRMVIEGTHLLKKTGGKMENLILRKKSPKSIMKDKLEEK